MLNHQYSALFALPLKTAYFLYAPIKCCHGFFFFNGAVCCDIFSPFRLHLCFQQQIHVYAIGFAHSEQNFGVPIISMPHLLHFFISGSEHSGQNFAPSFAMIVLHFGQTFFPHPSHMVLPSLISAPQDGHGLIAFLHSGQNLKVLAITLPQSLHLIVSPVALA
jgi:hypothetical protein